MACSITWLLEPEKENCKMGVQDHRAPDNIPWPYVIDFDQLLHVAHDVSVFCFCAHST
ncbi:hypothetical protein GJ744_000335 [Endocarpon pusillum]|uniref:Uncharacterized protein n=1 Tax=Endocarpon pusillum TaxID=364733 RepID=A0A8H7AP92_9EURO|nr:hypothetical protein GJ744_000335 [Endocarpon pusillum]